MRIIVTGGLGFIGSTFVNQWKKKYPTSEVVVVDKMTYAANVNNLKTQVKFIKKDICDVTAEDLGNYDYLINFAAETHVDNSISDGKPFIRTNVEGTFNLLEVARQNQNLKRFIQISTDEVYGDMADSMFEEAREDHILAPSSYYSATKAASDMLVQAAGRTYKLPYLITRTCNNYGENQHKEKLLPKMIECVRHKETLGVYGDGENIREWISAIDNSNRIIELIEENVEGIKNIGSGERYTNNQIIEIVEEIVGEPIKKSYIEDRKGHDRIYALLSKGVKLTTNLKDYLKQQLL